MAKVQNGEEIFPKVSTPPPGGHTNVTDDRQTKDGFAIAEKRNVVNFE